MYFYICPYCSPCPKAVLVKSTMEEVDCKYDKEDVCGDRHKCKDVMECKKCKSIFKITPLFLKEQKRKDKDG